MVPFPPKKIERIYPTLAKGHFFSESKMHFSNLPKNVPKTYLEMRLPVPGKFSAHFLGDLKNASCSLKKKQPLELLIYRISLINVLP